MGGCAGGDPIRTLAYKPPRAKSALRPRPDTVTWATTRAPKVYSTHHHPTPAPNTSTAPPAPPLPPAPAGTAERGPCPGARGADAGVRAQGRPRSTPPDRGAAYPVGGLAAEARGASMVPGAGTRAVLGPRRVRRWLRPPPLPPSFTFSALTHRPPTRAGGGQRRSGADGRGWNRLRRAGAPGARGGAGGGAGRGRRVQGAPRPRPGWLRRAHRSTAPAPPRLLRAPTRPAASVRGRNPPAPGPSTDTRGCGRGLLPGGERAPLWAECENPGAGASLAELGEGNHLEPGGRARAR